MDLEMYGISLEAKKDETPKPNWIVEKEDFSPISGIYLGEGEAPTSKGGKCPIWLFDCGGSPFVLLRMQKFKQDMAQIQEGDKVNIFMSTKGVLTIKKVE